VFTQDLALGQANERVIALEFERRGLPLIQPPPGRQPFDFFLPDGRSVEIKLDIRSQNTQYAAIEYPTIQRHADFYIHTLTYSLVFDHDTYQLLYNRGKVVTMGEQKYDGRLVDKRDMRAAGMFVDKFIKSLKQ
jgi:hypothetical protein